MTAQERSTDNELLKISHLSIAARSGKETRLIVNNVSLSLSIGEVLGLIGESGSGKTTVALAAMGYSRPGCSVAGGSVRFQGQELTVLPSSGLRSLWGHSAAFVAQNAASAMNPALRLGAQVIEAGRIHGIASYKVLRGRAKALLEELSLPDPDDLMSRFPHELSGGQLQRVQAAGGMCSSPSLLILDEPTSSLDVTTQVGVLSSLKGLIHNHNTAAIFVSHDIALVRQIADRVLVMRDGVVQEEGDPESLIADPRNEYTRQLIAAASSKRPPPARPLDPKETPLLHVRDLKAAYRRKIAVEGIELRVFPGRCLGIIGESGSGKSTVAKVISGFHRPLDGSVLFKGHSLPVTLKKRHRAILQSIQSVSQASDLALNPAQTVRQIICRPLSVFFGIRGERAERRLMELLKLVRLPGDLATRRPQQLSGGQLQRVNLARALAAEPALLICDEVTSALDSIVAASILDLLADLRKTMDMAMIFISHDMKAVAAISDEIAVMYQGRVVETGTRDQVLENPKDDYTKTLINSVPKLDVSWAAGATQN